MLLSWPDRLYVALAPARVDVMRVSGLVRRSVSLDALIPGLEVVNQAPWRSALQALAEALSAADRRARCEVVLSNHFCRYTVVPGNAGLADEEESVAYAKLRFDEIYGPGASAAWRVHLSCAPCGTSRLACAVDEALLEELRGTCSAARVKLVAVRPLLAASFDHWRRRFASGSFWFAAAEEGRLCLAAVDDFRWRSVTSQRVGRHHLAEELVAMRERALLNVPDLAANTVYLFSRTTPSERVQQLPGIHVLSGAEDGSAGPVRRLAQIGVFA